MANTINLKESEKKQESFAISVILHLILLMLFFIPAFSSYSNKPRPPQFQGIQVALGTPLAETRTKTQPSESAAPKAAPQKKEVAKPKASKAKPSKAQPQKVVSKMVEEDSPVKATKKKVETPKKEIDKAQEAKEKAEREKAEAAQKAQEAKEREAERKAAEKAAKEAAQKAAAEATAAKKAAAKSKFDSLIKNTNADGAPSKGDPKGQPNADALEGMTTGKGKAGNGLGDRGLLFAPEINDSSQRKGRVVVMICVGATGSVQSANFTQKGSTTTDSHLVQLAIESALDYKFSKSNIEEQCGEIIIDFKLR